MYAIPDGDKGIALAGIVCAIRFQMPFNVPVLVQQLLLQYLEPLHVFNVVSERGLSAKEQFQQQLVALDRVFDRFSQPLPQFFQAFAGKRVNVAFRLAFLFLRVTGSKSFFYELFQDRKSVV